jgi:16S rRNA (cytosine967-C5)-methyltransferase
MIVVKDPRLACIQALKRWEESEDFADDVLHEIAVATRLEPIDRALFTEMFYGVLRNRTRLDYTIAYLREGDLDSTTRNLLRLGLYQILHMRIPNHASVNETVELAGRARGLVNALLRRCIREEDQIRLRLEQSAPAIRFSHPESLITRWSKQYGEKSALQVCEWNNEPAEVFVRANTLKASIKMLLDSGQKAEPCVHHPLMLKVKQIPPSWIVDGLCYVQDPSTLMACELLEPQQGERILDACAAPGGKTSYIAQLMENTGQIVACDSSSRRLDRLHENLQRLGVVNASIFQIDWIFQSIPFEEGSFDRILLDAPCSNTGVIRRRIDVRWRLVSEDFLRMPERQLALTRKMVPLLKPGGVFVYSTCSMEPEENENLVDRISAEFPELRLIESRQKLPFRDHVDGAFAAKFQKL